MANCIRKTILSGDGLSFWILLLFIIPSEMVLAGIYPPKNYQKWSNSETVWQPIPIYSSSPDLGHIIGTLGICPSIDSFSAYATQIVDYSTDKNITALKSFLLENCGQPITGKNVVRLYDLFLCQIADGLSVPEWIQPYHLATMKSLYSQILENLFENTTLMKLLIPRAELQMWNVKLKRLNIQPITGLDALKYCSELIYPNLSKLFRIFCTLPVSTATPERMFSCLKRLKTYLRNTMKEERLNGLTLMAVHRNIPIRAEEVIGELTKKKEN